VALKIYVTGIYNLHLVYSLIHCAYKFIFILYLPCFKHIYSLSLMHYFLSVTNIKKIKIITVIYILSYKRAALSLQHPKLAKIIFPEIVTYLSSILYEIFVQYLLFSYSHTTSCLHNCLGKYINKNVTRINHDRFRLNTPMLEC
jgi:hypothetical protein